MSRSLWHMVQVLRTTRLATASDRASSVARRVSSPGEAPAAAANAALAMSNRMQNPTLTAVLVFMACSGTETGRKNSAEVTGQFAFFGRRNQVAGGRPGASVSGVR